MGIIFNPDLTNQGSERRRKMSVTGLLLTPLLLLALCSAAPYEVQTTTSAPASSAPEKLVKAVKSVHCTVQYVTIWDTKYEDQPLEVCETVYQQLCEVKSQRLCQNTTREECYTTYKSNSHCDIVILYFIEPLLYRSLCGGVQDGVGAV